MKDHSIDYNDSRTFILSYKIENNKIIAKLANGELYTIPYSKKNENRIISKMEYQARNAIPTEPGVTVELLSIFAPLSIPWGISQFIDCGSIFNGIILAIIIGESIYFPAKKILNTIKNEEIEKLNYFLDNKDKLNENIGKSENMTLGVRKKTIKQIELEKSKNNYPFNINNIDNYSLRDLKVMKKNLERIRYFGFDEKYAELEDKKEEKSLVLKKIK